MSPHHKPAVRFVFVTVLLDVLGIGLIIPVAPRLVEQLYRGSDAEAAPLVGALSATYALMQFVFAPILGSLSDRFGRRPVILISLFGSALDYFAAALSPTLWFLFVTRALNGVSGANITACNAYIADVTPPEKRAAGFGVIGAAFGLGFVLGPLLGGLLGEMHIRAPFWAAGALTLVNWAYGYFVLPESLPADRRRPFSLARANPLGTFGHLRRYPVVLELGASLFLLNMAMFGLHSTWVLYTKHRYHWGELDTGLSLTCVGVGAAIVQGGLARKIIPRLGEPRSLLVGLGIGVCAYLGYGLATQGWMIYVIILAASLGGIAQPAAQALITKASPATEQGEVQGALTSLSSIAAIIGYPLGATVFGYFIGERTPVKVPGAPYFLSAALALGGLLVAAWALRGRPGAGAGAGSAGPEGRGVAGRGKS
ncbi:MAG: TCR/Tet family MFS transporter [Phycisphaerales bacterium]|nr:TCR/Tet family MFS transporter [Phycisphaerales bacterium]